MSFAHFLLRSVPGRLAGLLLLGFAIVSVKLALTVDIDYYDAYQFKLQAKRFFTDGGIELGAPNYDRSRPKAYVGYLFLMNLVSRAVSGDFPSIKAYHLGASAITLAFLVAWVYLAFRWVSGRAALLLTALLVTQPLMIHYSFLNLSDFLSGLAVALLAFASGRFFDRVIQTRSILGPSLLLGGAGALLALSKNHFLVSLPLVLTAGGLLVLVLNRNYFRRFLSGATVAMLVGVGATDSGLRLMGDRGVGLWTHIYYVLVVQRREVALIADRTDVWLYVKNLAAIHGIGFWIAGLALTLWALARVGNFSRRIGLWTLVVHQAFFFVLLQKISYKETRYLAPMLPSLFLLFAWAFEKQLGRMRWSAVLGILCFLPAASFTYRDVRGYLDEPVYRSAQFGTADFWQYLKRPHGEDGVCRRVRACGYVFRTEREPELPNEIYYRNYYLVEPTYIYELGLPDSLTYECRRDDETPYAEFIEKNLGEKPRADTCYVVRELNPASSRQDLLTVVHGGKARTFFGRKRQSIAASSR